MGCIVKKSKIIPLGVLLIIALSLAVAFSVKSKFCLYGEGGKVCYKSNFVNSKILGKSIFGKFLVFLKTSESSKAIDFSDEIMGSYGPAISEKVRSAFSWVQKDSLVGVVIYGEYGALLLRNDERNGVLYFSAKNEKIVIDFDTKVQFLPIDAGWVNGMYGGEYSLTYELFGERNKICSFQESNVIFSSEAYSKVGEDKYICGFDKYLIIVDGKQVRVIPQDVDWEKKYVGLIDDTMRFLKFVSN